MELKEKDVLVVIKDELSFGDALNSQSVRNRESPIKGHVQIYEIVNGEKKLTFEKDNLVVYLGREYTASRIFNQVNPNLIPPYAPAPDEFICWFGLGSGGTYTPDGFDPAPPSSTNNDLVPPIMINFSDNINCGDLRSVPVPGYYKHQILPVIFEPDTNNASRYLIARVQFEIGIDDANTQIISEAGLFTAADPLGESVGPFHLFARVTFPSIYKSVDRVLFFIWYLYC